MAAKIDMADIMMVGAKERDNRIADIERAVDAQELQVAECMLREFGRVLTAIISQTDDRTVRHEMNRWFDSLYDDALETLEVYRNQMEGA